MAERVGSKWLWIQPSERDWPERPWDPEEAIRLRSKHPWRVIGERFGICGETARVWTLQHCKEQGIDCPEPNVRLDFSPGLTDEQALEILERDWR